MKDFLLVIDGSSLLTTQFFGNLPREIVFAKTMEEKEVFFPRIMQTSKGVYTNAVYGFMRVLLKILKEQNPTYLAVAWDLSRNTFRREIYPEYKGNRGETLVPLREQFVLCQQLLTKMNVRQFMDERYEADDFTGTLVTMFEKEVPVRIMTKDRDYLQLVSENTELWMIHPTAKKTEELYEKYNMRQRECRVPDRTFPFTPELVEKEFGVKPESVNSLKGLEGDPSDNIKGVPGIGGVTAAALIHEYGSVEHLYEVLNAMDEKGQKALAQDWKTRLGIKRSPLGPLLKKSDTELVGERAAMLSKTLATIKRDIPIDITLEQLRVAIDKEVAMKEFAALEFRSLKFEELEEEGDFVPAGENPFDGDGFESVGSSPFGNGGFAGGRENSKNFLDYFDQLMNPPVVGEEEAEATGAGKDLAGSKRDVGRKDTADVGQQEKSKQPTQVTFPPYSEPAEFIHVDTLPEELYFGDKLAFATFSDGAELLCVALQADAQKIYIASPRADEFAAYLKKAVEQGVRLVTLGLKEQLGALKAEKIRETALLGGLLDIKLLAYLKNPLAGAYSYSDLATEYFGISLAPYKEIFKKVTPKEAMFFQQSMVEKYLMFGCNMAFLLADGLLSFITARNNTMLYFELELPLIFTLFSMQERGILVAKEELSDYAAQLGARIKVLEEEIYADAGEHFNINSTKQLGVILFEKLGLSGGKKTKTGYSTAADVLERLGDSHPIIGRLLEYRQLSKLKSTYADGLVPYIAADGRIHSTFHQTITATGRISSTDPNLQNIPIRMEAGRLLRKVFIPADGFVFLDADYSQIELRVLAHMSGDAQLIAAYNTAQDIHRITASQVFHTPFEEVTKEQRSRAKAVNFGIVYGISSFGLGQGLNISRHEAEEYIEKYFATYPGVRQFVDGLVKDAREDGESRTLFGRIRPLPDISSSNHAKRAEQERIAMNSPIQGTAADIMKIAMLRVDRRLTESGLKSRLLLQIHDELLVETAVDEVEQVRKILTEEMAGAAKLFVPLEVDAKQGKNWLE
ncbi:MAG: DNA polymerase I, partial [Lachnospiraceae bacterium]|nr:DNA polymerase I [Lachnospiraceae bacterium]